MVEDQPKLFRVVATTIRDFWRGYSDQDLVDTHRWAQGIITPEEREIFRQRQTKAALLLSNLMFGPGRMKEPGIPPIPDITIGNLRTDLTNLDKLGTLSDAQLNEIIQQLALEDLRRWGKL